MDSCIMKGSDLSMGAVAGVSCVRNAVTLAKAVMEKTSHCMLAGDGPTKKFAQSMGMELVGQDVLVHEETRKEYEHFKMYGKAVGDLFGKGSGGGSAGHDTVGCVCRDMTGSLAAATSTGGIPAKMAGRVGDSPLVGSGAYADDSAGAVSTTGHGESLMKVCLAKDVVERVRETTHGQASPSEAVLSSLQMMDSRVNGQGGAICINKSGEPGMAYTTEKMAWAVARPGLKTIGGVHAPTNPE